MEICGTTVLIPVGFTRSGWGLAVLAQDTTSTPYRPYQPHVFSIIRASSWMSFTPKYLKDPKAVSVLVNKLGQSRFCGPRGRWHGLNSVPTAKFFVGGQGYPVHHEYREQFVPLFVPSSASCLMWATGCHGQNRARNALTIPHRCSGHFPSFLVSGIVYVDVGNLLFLESILYPFSGRNWLLEFDFLFCAEVADAFSNICVFNIWLLGPHFTFRIS